MQFSKIHYLKEELKSEHLSHNQIIEQTSSVTIGVHDSPTAFHPSPIVG